MQVQQMDPRHQPRIPSYCAIDLGPMRRPDGAQSLNASLLGSECTASCKANLKPLLPYTYLLDKLGAWRQEW